jgi:hypothetical protein
MVTLGLLVLLLVIGYWLLIMGRRNAEAKLYEAALEADNMRQALHALESKTDIDPLQVLVDELVVQLESGRKRSYVSRAVQQLRSLDLSHIQMMLSHGQKITTMDKR